MTKFEKVTFSRFAADRRGRSDTPLEEDQLQREYESIELPRRSTLYSAGYDIRTPYTFTIEPGQSRVIATGLRALMEADRWMGIYIRSSLGFKHGIRLVNSVAVIDADYSGAENEGHLMVGIYNGGDHAVTIRAGEAFAQGIFQQYLRTDTDDPVNQIRTGGFGSTDA